VDVAIYEDQARWITNGSEATLTTRNGQEITGKLRIVSPLLDPATRTVTARMDVTNPHDRHRPGDFVDVTVHADPRRALAVPRNAVLRSGSGDFVMKHEGDGRFVLTAVKTGVESNLWIEITDGLKADDEIAASGQFLLAAEASLQDLLARSVSTTESASKPMAQ
jgi:Cu(I)/Ag(I) efflux system membrane fusion protein